MKKIATTLLLAFAFLGTGCSDSQNSQTGPNPSLTPMPDYTLEEIAAMKEDEKAKAAQGQKEEQPPLTAATSAPIRTIVATQILNTPTPTP